jgi:hypothetical protein
MVYFDVINDKMAENRRFFMFFYLNDTLETPNSSKLDILLIVLLEDT